jgi:hypothetical protein
MRVENVVERSAKSSVEARIAPIMLTPTSVEKMLARRMAVQVVRFRTTCTDCVPNL